MEEEKNKKISVVIPMYYEEKVVEECYNRLKNVLEKLNNYDYELIFINDGSQDNTLFLLEEIASKNPKVKVISFSRNFGTSSSSNSWTKICKWRCNCNYRCRFARPTRENPEMLELWENGYEGYLRKKKKQKR